MTRLAPSGTDMTELPQLLQEKERRAQQQLERCAEERGRKMEEQRRKEQQRRAAAEEKRRQQQEAEKERLEALVRRRTGGADRRGGGGNGGGEARDHLENRPKRWTWGGPPDGVEGNPKTPPCNAMGSAQPKDPSAASCASQSRHVDFLSPPTSNQPISKQLSNSSAALNSPEKVSFVSRRTVSPGNHRPMRTSSNRRSIAGLPEESLKAKTPTGETPNTPIRSSSFRANSKAPATPKRVRSNRSRAQSPCSPGQYPPSPLRQRATTPGSDDRGHSEVKGHGSLERKPPKTETSEKKIPKSSSRELTAESPGTPTARSVGGTMDAEEASRLLAERRRLARIQKEQEEKQRQERIEEIMKRTRKSDVESPSAASTPEMKAEALGASEEDAATPAEAPIIMLGPLESRSCLDELSDGVQSMDVSPVSRDEPASAQEFSPVAEGPDGCLLEQLMDRDLLDRGQRQGEKTLPYPKLQAGSGVGDLNKNLLIQAYSAASESSQLIPSVGPGKLDIQ
uniref:MAP7 domain containing 2b n=1 Tax=Oryzias melastigma TaxID=30732 RepID=A0A3B3CI18_ORYME